MGMPTPLARLPSLDLIRGFVAVGRRMSITMAAQDLCLTQSAVSRQIHALEEQLGVKLLVRGYRSISFTPEGLRLFRSADGAVQQLQESVGELRHADAVRPVTLTSTIGITGLWLLPRPLRGCNGNIPAGRLPLIQPLLRDGRLVQIDTPAGCRQIDHAYWLIQADERPRQEVGSVAQWIAEEARQSV